MTDQIADSREAEAGPGLRERIQEILDRTDKPKSGQTALSSDQAVEKLRALLSDLPPIHPVFEPSLRNDGTHEYTETGSCDGSQKWTYRRTPAFHSDPSSWEEIESIPAGAKYDEF